MGIQLKFCELYTVNDLYSPLCILLKYVKSIFEISAMCNVFNFIPHNIQMQCWRI